MVPPRIFVKTAFHLGFVFIKFGANFHSGINDKDIFLSKLDSLFARCFLSSLLAAGGNSNLHVNGCESVHIRNYKSTKTYIHLSSRWVPKADDASAREAGPAQVCSRPFSITFTLDMKSASERGYES